jgi:predicted Zn-dependent protease
MWTGQIRLSFSSSACLFVLVLLVGNEVQAQQLCTSIPALKIRPVASIFGVEQERILGDIEAQFVEQNYPVVHDDESAEHLNTVANRILSLSLFPPDRMRVRIILIDTPEAASFSVGPERIYLTRKMIRLLKNDDELAGLLGHELGHILTHQNAIMVSQLFHEILGVSSISDRKDIAEK